MSYANDALFGRGSVFALRNLSQPFFRVKGDGILKAVPHSVALLVLANVYPRFDLRNWPMPEEVAAHEVCAPRYEFVGLHALNA